MSLLLNIFIFIPFIGFVISLLIPKHKESFISKVATYSIGLHLICFVIFFIFWILQGFQTLNLKDFVLYKNDNYEFFIDFCFDHITAVYLFVGAFLSFLVIIYSQQYLHRERGYKRFYNTILFFYLGYNVTILSGNLETLFVGWEVLGISSFLLIAFYRDRYLPVKNALKVFSIYRIGDVGIILAMWMSHHLWHENITFVQLNNYQLVHEQLQSHSFIGVFISLMILLAAAAKSAQLPFSSWLPRAMEGPTPSTAIFYGSLSVHLGVFILMRTFPFWEHQMSVRILIGVLGLGTSIIASGIARVQSSIKSQIAYASIAQIGLIFIEVALGLDYLALVHFAGNAFLRTYQLLVSPSVVSYLIREQVYDFTPHAHPEKRTLWAKIENTFYVLCLKEWNLDANSYRFYWNPLKSTGKALGFLTVRRAFLFFIPGFAIGLFYLYHPKIIPESIKGYLPVFFSLLGLIMVLKSFTEKKDVLLAWILLIMNHLWISLALSFNEYFHTSQAILYISGIVISGMVGYFCLRRLRKKERIDLVLFQGHIYEYSRLAFIFLMACLGLSGFPITPTFIGEDVIFSHIHEDQYVLAFIVSLGFVINGLAIVRLYAKIFMGPHVKSYHEVAFKSS